MSAPGEGQADGHHHHSTLSRAVRAVAGVTLLSRLGGLVRDVILVRVFGATEVGSAFQAAFAIPNMFRRLFGEGALSAAFIPEYTDATKVRTSQVCPGCGYDGRGLDPSTYVCPECAGPLSTHAAHEAGALASLTIRWLAIVTCALTAVTELVLLVLLFALPPDPARELSLKLIMVMLPFMPLICSVAILAGMLQVHGKFGASATGPLVLNAFIIVVGAYFLFSGAHATETAAYVIGIATVLSGGTQAIWFARLLRPHVWWAWGPGGAALARPRAVRMFRKFVPVLIGLGTLQLSALLDTCIAMWPIWVGKEMFGRAVTLDSASNVILAAAQRLYQFPLGVFGIAVATAVFPLLAHAAGDAARFTDTLRRGIRLSLFISLPATAGLILVGRELCAVLYSGGHRGFGPEDIDRCANVLAGYSAAIWAYSLNHVLTRAFYASKDTGTPMRVALVFAAINLATNLTLIWPLREAGLAWSTAACATLQSATLTLLIRRRLNVAVFDRATLVASLRLVLATVAMAACVGALLWLWPTPAKWSGHLARLAGASLLGGLAYAALSALTRAPELGWLLRPARPDTLRQGPADPPPVPEIEP